jgi:hypothetical protein
MENDMSTLRKTMTGVVAALAFAGPLALASTEASAAGRWRHHHGGGNWAGPMVAGLIGGLALGAIASSASRRSYGDYGSSYYPTGGYHPAAGYYGEAGYGAVSCVKQRRPAYDEWGRYIGHQKVRVCY